MCEAHPVSIRAVLACNGREGIYDCRQATPVGEVLTARDAREIAKTIHKWSSEVNVSWDSRSGRGSFVVRDYCQSCTRKRAEGK